MLVSESSFNLFDRTAQMQRYVTPANMVMRRHQSVEIKQNPNLPGSFVGIETHGDKKYNKTTTTSITLTAHQAPSAWRQGHQHLQPCRHQCELGAL
jgi:hypothetical protein